MPAHLSHIAHVRRESMTILRRVTAAALFIVVLGALWAFPPLLFPRPATNEAIALSGLELPILFIALLAAVAAMVALRRRRLSVAWIGLGAFLIGVAIDLILGLSLFGNLSDDRFLALLLLPVPIGLVGLATLVVGLVTGGMTWKEVSRGVGVGVAGAILAGGWILLRGAQDWLLAPYGFDITLLVVMVGAAVVVLGSTVLRPPAESHK